MGHSFPFLHTLSQDLLQMDAIPLFGASPPFDWERFSSLIASHLGTAPLQLHMGGQEWREAEDLKAGLGSNLLITPLTLAPLQGDLLWLMSEEDVARLTAWMLHGKAKASSFSSQVLQEGFYRYLLLQALDAAQNLPIFKGLSLHLNEETLPLIQTRAFCIDIEIDLDPSSCWGRLVISPTLQKSWARHFTSHRPIKNIPSSLPFSVQIGSVSLPLEEWNRLQLGDWLVLDHCSYHPQTKEGQALLCLQGQPVIRVQCIKNQLSFLDLVHQHEDPMEHPSSQEESALTEVQKIPLSISVELARVHMPLEKLQSLQEGNVLPLEPYSEQQVTLKIAERTVARGELVCIGETFGVKILEIG